MANFYAPVNKVDPNIPLQPLQSSSAPPKRRLRAPPTDYFELELPLGYYRTKYTVTVPEKFQHGTSSLYYTASTLNWDKFTVGDSSVNKPPYTLHQQETKQTNKIMVIITMHDETVDKFIVTLHSVYENIKFLVEQYEDAGVQPLEIVVCIVCDGRKHCNPEVKLALELLGTYQADELILTDFSEDPVLAHIFEHLSPAHLEQDKHTKEIKLKESTYPMRFLLCMKEYYRDRIDSHAWALKAFAPLLDPEICIFVGIGTKLERESFYHFWMNFDKNENLGALCGELKIRLPGKTNFEKAWNLVSKPLLAAQNFENKMENLEKSVQSTFGYISSLPRDFSAYRYQALVGKPLDEYFFLTKKRITGEDLDFSTLIAVTTANKYLAESRVLAFEIFTKRGEQWTMQYVKEASSKVQAYENLGEFFKHSRSVFNGSFFAFLSAVFSITSVQRSNHSTLGKVGFYLEMLYLLINILFLLFAPMNFFGVFVVLWNEAVPVGSTSTFYVIAAYGIIFFFGMLVFIGNDPQGKSSRNFYFAMSFVWGVCVIAMLALLVVVDQPPPPAIAGIPNMFLTTKFFSYSLALLSCYLLYLLSSSVLALRDFHHMFTSIIGYLLFFPTLINMVLPFAFANIHDVNEKQLEEPVKKKKAVVQRNSQSDALSVKVLRVDVDKLVNNIIVMSDEKERKKQEREVRRKESKTTKQRRIRQENLEKLNDRQKVVRMIVLFVYIMLNSVGSLLIAYFSVYKPNKTGPSSFSAVSVGDQWVVASYMGFIFGFLIAFAAITFLGTVIFVLKTRGFKPKKLITKT
ncbi:hypothetical protein HK098_006888 [Nowakowskiella sp. JEL0407]|nr:hypothetical protein HK098_006888 [Nowakowskiella sp. JEL0407]